MRIYKGQLDREYCIPDDHLDACLVSNTPRGVLGNRNNPDIYRIRVDGQIRFECGYVWENQGQEKMRNPIAKRTRVVSLILCVDCVQYSFKQSTRETIIILSKIKQCLSYYFRLYFSSALETLFCQLIIYFLCGYSIDYEFN